MAAKIVSIEFDRSYPCYYPGELISGTVQITPEISFTCAELFITSEWRATGTRTDIGDREKVLLAKQISLPAGAQAVYHFKFVAPGEPISYKGKIIDISCYASAVLKGGSYPTESCGKIFFIKPRSGVRKADNPVGHSPENKNVTANNGNISDYTADICLALCSFTATLAAVIHNIRFLDFKEMPGMASVLLLIILLFAYAGIYFGILCLNDVLSSKMLGGVTYQISPKKVRPGEEITIHLQCKPKSPDIIRKISSKLYLTEWADDGENTSESDTNIDILEYQPASNQIESQDTSVTFVHEIPPDVVPNFRSEHNEISWSIKLRIKVKEKRFLLNGGWEHVCEVTIQA
jgi:3-hydroxymyristoyl/3-hydroxydecanoyl-(acyl carrier protein) dehydratase